MNLVTKNSNHVREDAAKPFRVSRTRRHKILLRVVQLLLVSGGAILIFVAFAGQTFRDDEGFLTGRIVLPIAVGVASLFLAWAVSGRWRAFALWLSLALVGQAVALQLIEAGPHMRYQHYKPITRLLTETHILLLLFIALQATLVAAGLIIRWSKLRAWIRRTFKLWQLLLAAAAFFLSSATVSQQIPIYIGELFIAAFVQFLALGTIVISVWEIPPGGFDQLGRVFHKLFGPSGEQDSAQPGGIDRFVVMAAVWVFAFAAALSFFSYERHPHIPDEVAYLYQARFFANGVLAMPAPPVPEAFDFYLMQFEPDSWYPSPPPGWPAMLALGTRVGLPWLVNPVLGAVNVLLIYVLLREFYSRRTARLVVLLLCLSPWFVFMAMNFMTHTFTLTCALVAAIGVAWARRIGKAWWAWLGGVALGVMTLVRPLEALIMAGLVGLWSIGLGGRRLRVSAIAGLVIAVVTVGSVGLVYNKRLTGDPTTFPIMAYTDEYFGPNSNAFGFGPDRGMDWPIDPYPGHSPRDALVNANLNTFSINIELFGWGTGSLLLVVLFVIAGRLRKPDFFMIAVIVAVFGAHFFYYFSGGPDFGARYWFLMVVPLVALTVRGIRFFGSRPVNRPAESTVGDARVLVAVLSLCLIALVNFFLWRATDKYHHYLGMRPDIRHLADEYGFGDSLVLIRGDQHPDYASAANYNPVDVYGDGPIYVRERNPEVRARVLAAYAERPVWIVEGPTLTSAGFRVVAGPLTIQELLDKKGNVP